MKPPTSILCLVILIQVCVRPRRYNCKRYLSQYLFSKYIIISSINLPHVKVSFAKHLAVYTWNQYSADIGYMNIYCAKTTLLRLWKKMLLGETTNHLSSWFPSSRSLLTPKCNYVTIRTYLRFRYLAIHYQWLRRSYSYFHLIITRHIEVHPNRS